MQESRDTELLASWLPKRRLVDVALYPPRQAYVVFSAILIIALWVALHPYRGIIHDARLYAVQALNVLQDGAYGGDLYFKYGSQDQFSPFSTLYADVVSLVGLSSAHLILTIL